MKYKKSFIFICLIICLFSIASISAGDVNDTIMASEDTQTIEVAQADEITTTDESQKTIQTDDTEILTASNGETTFAQNNSNTLSLKEKTYEELFNSITGGYKNLQPAYYKYNGEDYTIAITTPGVINGNGAIIDMAGSTIRAFSVYTNGVTFKNLTIKNVNYADNEGGGIYFSSSGTVENCNFVNNSAPDDNGGAVYFENNGTVINCNFTNNFARSGGAVYFSGSGTVENCNFVNNTAVHNGGAVLGGGYSN